MILSSSIGMFIANCGCYWEIIFEIAKVPGSLLQGPFKRGPSLPGNLRYCDGGYFSGDDANPASIKGSLAPESALAMRGQHVCDLSPKYWTLTSPLHIVKRNVAGDL